MGEPVIRLDKSKGFSTNHGDMLPDDPLYRVRFWQGGTLVYQGKKHTVLLPFDIEGELVPPEEGFQEPTKGKDAEGKDVTYKPLYTPLMKMYLEARKRRAAQVASVPSNEPQLEDDGDGDEDMLGGAGATDEVNLQAWLRGEVEYQPHAVRKAAQERYAVSKTRIADLVVELVLDHKLVPESQLGQKWKAVIEAHDKQNAQGQAA